MTAVLSSTAPPPARTLAVVEAATQLLNVIEWAQVSGAVGDLRVIVLPPHDRYSLRQNAAVGRLATDLGIALEERRVRVKHPSAISEGARVARAISGAQRLVLGDPFSGYLQTMLPMARADEVVVVDDGTATWEFTACIDAGSPLHRWRATRPSSVTRAARATRLLSPSAQRRLTMFTCLQGATPVGAHRVDNGYAWTRSWQRPTVVDDWVDVLGSSMVACNLVEREAYVQAVAALVRRHGQVRFVAHRRESENVLAEIATLPGLQILRPELPAELALRHGPVARQVVAFPSTAAYTLPIVLADVDVQVTVQPIDRTWFTAAATPHARDFALRIADRASAAAA